MNWNLQSESLFCIKCRRWDIHDRKSSKEAVQPTMKISFLIQNGMNKGSQFQMEIQQLRIQSAVN